MFSSRHPSSLESPLFTSGEAGRGGGGGGGGGGRVGGEAGGTISGEGDRGEGVGCGGGSSFTIAGGRDGSSSVVQVTEAESNGSNKKRVPTATLSSRLKRLPDEPVVMTTRRLYSGAGCIVGHVVLWDGG
jgi:hypothetical protein